MIKQINEDVLNELFEIAQRGPRKRSHKIYHEGDDASVQRFVVALTEGTYLRPHIHPQKNKWEMIIALSGRIGVIIFSEDGIVSEKIELDADSTNKFIEIPSGTWHTLFPITKRALMMEIKEGPYIPFNPNNFAAWSPKEGDEIVNSILLWFENAKVGEKFQS